MFSLPQISQKNHFVVSILIFLCCYFYEGILIAQGLTFEDDRKDIAWIISLGARQGVMSEVYSTLYADTRFPSLPHEHPIVRSVGGTLGFEGGLTDFSYLYFSTRASVYRNFYPEELLEGGHFRLNNEPRLTNRIRFDQTTVALRGLIGGRLNPKDRICFNFQTGIIWSIAAGPYIEYDSSQPEFDAAVEAALNDGNRSRNNLLIPLYLEVDAFVGGGSTRLVLQVGYEYGLVDVLRTYDNPFNWSDQNNRWSGYLAELGLIIKIK